MTSMIDTAAVRALANDPVDWRFKGLPVGWAGRTPAQICADAPKLFDNGPLSPLCVLSAEALAHNLATMARWCDHHGVQLAPHGKTHMAPQLLAMQFDAGACAVTAATISQVRVFRAFGVNEIVLANELVDAAGLCWLAAESNAAAASDTDFRLVCWVDSVAGVQIMDRELAAAGLRRPLEVCVEVGAYGGRTGCRTLAETEAVAQAVVAAPRLRLAGVAGYEAAAGHDVSPSALEAIRRYLAVVRTAAMRLAPLVETDDMLVTAGGSTYFDLVADLLTGWPDTMRVRTVLRSGAYLTHDDGLYRRTSPLTRDDARSAATKETLLPALSVWAQVCSVPEPELALVTMGRRDVAFDQDLPVPRGLATSSVTKLADQHAFLTLGATERVRVGDWLQFGISHPCTVFDKWQLIPVLDADDRVVDLIRTFF